MNFTPDLIAIAALSLFGNVLGVWGIVRHELATMRKDIERAHTRIDSINATTVVNVA